MRREGSPFQGLGTVAVKELADNLSSARVLVLELLIVLTALAALYGAIDDLRQNTAEDPFLLLRLFTVDHAPLPSFVAILGFLIPLMAIGLGFDAINSEHNRRTLSRILAQPIYRDALLMGKFLAGLDDARFQPGGAVAAGDRPRPDLPRRPAGRGGNRALAGVPGDRDFLRRGLAFARDAAVDRVPLAGDRGTGCARHLAVPDRAVADAGAGARAGDLAAGSALCAARAAIRRIPPSGRRRWRGCRRTICSARRCWRCCRRPRGRSVRCFWTNCGAR